MRRPQPTTDVDLAVLTTELHPKLVGILALYTGDRHLAEDLAQETLIRLHLNWPTVREHANPTAWASRVALNLAGSWWRRRGAERRANRRSGMALDAAHTTDPADVIAVRDAVAGLPRRQRAVVILRFYQGLSVRDTSAALGCPEGTVKSLTSSAVAALRRELDLTEAGVVTDPIPPIPMETFHA